MRNVLKWFAIGWIGLWVLVIGAVVLAIVLRQPVKDASVLRVTFDGELAESPSAGLDTLFDDEPSPTLHQVTRSLRQAATDQRIKGVVLEVKSPQVSLAQVQEIDQAMATVRKAGKWSTAFLETAGELSSGNGAYALAATAQRIVLAPSGEVGLTGLRAEVPFVRGLLDKLAIEPYFEKRYAYKTAANTFTQTGFTAEHKESLASLVDALQNDLITQVAARRSVSQDTAWQWVRGGPYGAEQALKLGLVDELGYWDAVESTARAEAGRDDPFVSLTAYAGDLPRGQSDRELALIIGDGAIQRGEGGGFGNEPTMGSDTIAKALRDAREAEVAGVLLRINSPGGSYIASDLIRREVGLTRDAGIPVVVSMGSVAASGGYFIAMQADRIFAEPATLTGSIGVYGGTFATRRFFEEWLGITFGVYEAAPESASFSTLDPPDAATKKKLAEMVDRIYDDFVHKAAKGRNKTPEEIHAVAQGRVWSGRQALERGLIDELGGQADALAYLEKKVGIHTEPRLLRLPEPESPWHILGRLLEARTETRALESTRRLLARITAPGEHLLAMPFDIELH